MNRTQRRGVLSWALYDWANSAFATVVMAGFFPVYFKQFWAAGLDTHASTLWLGMTNSLASLVIVLLAPLLGAIGDRGGRKKRLLLFSACLGILMTGALFWVAQGHWALALTLYLGGILGFSGGNVFYDALLVEVTVPSRYDRVSALGFALGYLGGGLLFAFDVLMTLFPGYFGLEDAAQAVRLSFVSVAIWWAIFAIPVFLFVPESKAGSALGWGPAIRGGFAQLAATFRRLRGLREVFLFLLAYWFYIDGVDTIVRMAVDYGLSLGFQANNLMLALLITQFVGFPAALAFGRLGERRGAKQGIMLAIFAYLLMVLWAYRMHAVWEFYGLAVGIGLVQGGIQALSRSLYARLIPAGQAGEFFGFYNMLGKFAAVLGPVLVGWVSVATGSSRLSLLSIALLFIIGAVLLVWVREPPAGDPA